MKIITFHLIAVILAISSYAQKGGSGSGKSEAVKIPGMEQHQIINNDKQNRPIGKDSLIQVKSGKSFTLHEKEFVESIINPGFPAGWITNAAEPILRHCEFGEPFIELDGKADLYLGRLVEISFDSSNDIVLSYFSETNVSLYIHQFTENNVLNAEKIEIIIPQGNHLDKAFEFTRNETTKRILLRFEKPYAGLFKLYRFVMIGGDI